MANKDYSYLLKDVERAESRNSEKLNPDQKLSLCMIVKNEEKYLEDALISVQDIVDEMIVVDTGSTDKTVEIARKYGAKVYFKAWENDFSAARNESLKHATGQWVLVMDADERVPEGFKDNLRALLVDTDAFLSYAIFIKSIITINKTSIQDTFGHYLVRLFKKMPEVEFHGAIHEQVSPSYGNVSIPQESFHLEHLGYADHRHLNDKQKNRNIPLIEKYLEKTKESGDDNAYSFYAFYKGTFVNTPSERLFWLMESIDKGGAPEQTPHLQVAMGAVLTEYYSSKNYREGLDFAEAQVGAFPFLRDHKGFMEFMGVLYLANKNYKQAIDIFECVLNTEGNTDAAFAPVQNERTGSWGTCLHLVLAHKLQGQIEQAKHYAHKTLSLCPAEDKEPILERIALILDDNSVAEDYFSEEGLVEGNHHTAIQVKNLSNHYLRKGQPYNALLLQSQLYASDKVEKNACQLALNYIDQQQVSLASQVFSALQILFPEGRLAKIGAYYLEALNNAQAPDEQVLVEELNHSLSIPELKLLLHMAMVFSFAQMMETLFEKLESYEEEHHYVALRRALIDQQKGNISSAIRRLEALIKADKTYFDAYIQLGNILLGEGDFSSAEKIFNIACQLKTSDWYAYYGFSLSLAGQDRLESAKRALSLAGRLSSGHPTVLSLMNLILTQEAQQMEHMSTQ